MKHFFGVCVCLAALGCGGGRPPSDPSFAGPGKQVRSSARDRRDLALTIYNGGFGLVRDVRALRLPEGRVSLEWQDVAAHVQPSTVQVVSLADPRGVSVFEQNYRYDLLTPDKLLAKHVGKSIRLHRWNEAAGRDDDIDATLISYEGAPLVSIGGEISAWYDRISFRELPADLQVSPTLALDLGSRRDEQSVELAYVTSGMSWNADYVLTLDDKVEHADLQGWVTLKNESGTSFENASLRLVAGDVQKLAEDAELDPPEMEAAGAMLKADMTKEESFKEEQLFEYHLYTLQRKASVLQNEQKQISLLQAPGIKVKRVYRFESESRWYRDDSLGHAIDMPKIGTYIEIENKEQNHLGIPLPKGNLRVFMNDPGGMRQLVGEDQIDHTPRDEKLDVRLGESFDVSARRNRTDLHYLSGCSTSSDWEIEIFNHKSTPITVELREPVSGEWTIEKSSHPATKEDAQTFLFTPTVPAGGSTKVTYRVRVKWC
jgi:hypothetical protein